MSRTRTPFMAHAICVLPQSASGESIESVVSTSTATLYGVAAPPLEAAVVCNPRRNPLLKEGSKSDKVDARKLAELLRSGMLRAVYHGENGLQTLRGVGVRLSDDQQRPGASDESAQGAVSKLGHCLRR